MSSFSLNKNLFAFIAGASVFAIAGAVPPVPGFISARQPDGSEVKLSLRGDEHFAWGVSPDGYTLMMNPDGFWTVATADVHGEAIHSSLIYKGMDASILNPDVRPGLPVAASHLEKARAARRRVASNIQIDNSFPTKGKHNLLMLLVNFADTKTTFSRTDFDNYMNQENYGGIGSFRDFYLENSYGQLDVTTTVSPWITVPNEKNYYNNDNVPEMIYYALKQLSGSLDLSKFDNDGDGVIDGIAVIHQGTGQEASGNALEIWSHSSIVYGLSVDGLRIGRYTIQPEKLATTGGISTIGVMVHEFGHNLGAPDFYDTDYSANGQYPGTGVWDLMGSGAWNGNNGDRPAGINMWQKIQYGWVKPVVLTSDTKIHSMEGATFSPVAYRFDTTVPGEYFIIENRQREGRFDSALPGEGLLIYHADESLISAGLESNDFNARYPQGMYTVSAAAFSDPKEGDPSSYGIVDKAPFTGLNGSDSFSDTTLPSTRSNSGRYSYCGLHNISINTDGTANFDFRTETAPASPFNLTANAVRGIVTLNWQIDPNASVKRYNVYRNGNLIARTTAETFTDSDPQDARLIYNVDAEHTSGLISPYTTTTMRLPVNTVDKFTATERDGGADLSWNIKNRLTRLSDGNWEPFGIVDLTASKGEFAHRFRADDMATFTGMKIRSIGFCPYFGPSEASCTLKVWETEAGSDKPEVISQRLVKEFGAFTWNSILLTKQVEIKPGKDYWIGIEIVPDNKSLLMLTDLNDPLQGYGNLVRLDDGTWQSYENARGSWYLYADLTNVDSSAGAQIESFGELTDGDLEMSFPIGFAIYRDGERLGVTSSRSYTDRKASLGDHTYEIASIYKGGNESGSTQASVTVTAIESAVAPETTIMSTAPGAIEIEGCAEAVIIADITGRIVYSAPVAPTHHIGSLPAGIYIVRTLSSATKVAVR